LSKRDSWSLAEELRVFDEAKDGKGNSKRSLVS